MAQKNNIVQSPCDLHKHNKGYAVSTNYQPISLIYPILFLIYYLIKTKIPV